MGLNTRDGSGSSSKVYLKISNGRITREWKEQPKQDWVPIDKELLTRTISKGKNEGQTRWYVEYSDVSGKLLNVEVKKVEKSNIIELYLQDGPETFILTIPEDSSYGKDFMLKMRNIDITREIYFSPWSMSPDKWFELTGKKRSTDKVGLSIYHDKVEKENAVKPFYTKEEPNGLPPLVEKIVKGEKSYDSTDHDNFLYDELLKWVEEVSKSLNGPSSTAQSSSTVDDAVVVGSTFIEADEEEEFNPDDLPF